jgi:hypothetical protein
VGNGRTEHGHDAVAQDLVHRPFVAVDGFHHVLQGRIEEPLSGFGVEVTDQLRRAFEVGEQRRDLFAFAFQGTARGQDFLRRIGGRVGQWGRGLHQRGSGGRGGD